jgi:hypothetical protein
VLLTSAIETGTVLAQDAVSRSPCKIVPFDVVSFRAGDVVVIYIFAGTGRVPRSSCFHVWFSSGFRRSGVALVGARGFEMLMTSGTLGRFLVPR